MIGNKCAHFILLRVFGREVVWVEKKGPEQESAFAWKTVTWNLIKKIQGTILHCFDTQYDCQKLAASGQTDGQLSSPTLFSQWLSFFWTSRHICSQEARHYHCSSHESCMDTFPSFLSIAVVKIHYLQSHCTVMCRNIGQASIIASQPTLLRMLWWVLIKTEAAAKWMRDIPITGMETCKVMWIGIMSCLRIKHPA